MVFFETFLETCSEFGKSEFPSWLSKDVWRLTLCLSLLVLNIKLHFRSHCDAVFKSSLCHRELFKFLLFKYWNTQWASATFCPSFSSSEAQYNDSLYFLFFGLVLSAILSQLGGLKPPRARIAGKECRPAVMPCRNSIKWHFALSAQEIKSAFALSYYGSLWLQ